ncbi:MAG: Gfo/Idh/MocA family oxidoreductase [Lentisphaerae bacterium]|nr:Gfo/Idh/MocA family oxidoreductase [Lentisphaerota bacterium]
MQDEKSLRLGFVGVRNIGLNHLRKALDLPGVAVAAVADTDPQRVAAALELVPGGKARGYDSAAALFAAPDVDAVVLALPNHLHAPLSIEAMQKGKDVLVEKPMAVNSAEARDMIRVRDETGQQLMVGMNQRFNAYNVAARKMIAAGVIGEVQQCRTRWLRDRTGLWGGARGAWCLTPEKSGGGPLMDLGIHKLDQALYLAGVWPTVEQIAGFVTTGIGRQEAAAHGAVYEIEDYACGLVRFEGGLVLTVEASYFCNLPGEVQDTTILGTEGAMLLAKGKGTLLKRTADALESVPLEPDPETATSCVEHFCRVLQGREPLIPTPEVGLQGLEIVEGIYAAAKK